MTRVVKSIEEVKRRRKKKLCIAAVCGYENMREERKSICFEEENSAMNIEAPRILKL